MKRVAVSSNRPELNENPVRLVKGGLKGLRDTKGPKAKIGRKGRSTKY